MPYLSNPAGRPENEFNKTRRIYYERKSRSPNTNVITSSDKDLKHIRNLWCPFHGEEARFDDLIRHDYIYICCGMSVPPEISGIRIKDDGIMTIDGRVTNNPVYGLSSSAIAPSSIPANKSRSKSNRKLPLSPDDQMLVKQGYTMLHIQEDVRQPSKVARSFDSSSPVRLDDYDILDKYNRSRGLSNNNVSRR